MARTYRSWPQLKSVSVCPFGFESVKLTKLTLRRCRSPLPKKTTPGFFFLTKNNCLKRSHGVECHQPMVPGGIQKVLVAEILAVDSVSSISDGPK